MSSKNTCNICGGNLVPVNGRWRCEYCGAYAPISISDDASSLLAVANQDLRNNRFDDAYDKFKDIIRLYSDISDAYWGLCCAEYGIKLEEDYDGKRIPTCYNASYESILDNPNFITACKLADNEQKEYYKRLANTIESVRVEWATKAKKEKPYDIFLSYKATDENGRTVDENEVYDLYNLLTSLNYRVFFAKVSLQDKTGEKYEPYIFNALNTAKVMIVYGSKTEYFDATWVKNEWKRYIRKITNHEKADNSLIVVYKGLNPANLPRPLNKIQSLDRDKLGFEKTMLSRIESIIKESQSTPKIEKIKIKEIEEKKKLEIETIKKKSLSNNVSIKKNGVDYKQEEVQRREIGNYQIKELEADDSKKIKIAEAYLKQNNDKYIAPALKIYNEILSKNPNNAEALIGKVLCENRKNSLDALFNQSEVTDIIDYGLLIEAISYSSKDDATKLLSYLSSYCLKLSSCDIHKAKEVYKNIMSYDSKSVRSLHSSLLDQAVKSMIKENDDYKFILDNCLIHIYSSFNEYIEKLRLIIDSSVSNGLNEYVKIYLDKYSKTIGNDYYYITASLSIKYSMKKVVPLTKTLERLVKNGNVSELDEIISTSDIETSNKALNDCVNVLNNLLSLDDTKYAYSLLSFLLEIDFENRDRMIKNTFDKVIRDANTKYEEIFELLLKTFTENESDKYINSIVSFAYGLLTNDDYSLASKYFDKALEYDPKNINAIYGKWLSILKKKKKEDILKNLHEVEDFTMFERLLSLCVDQFAFKNLIDEYVDECIYIGTAKELISDKIFNVFERLIGYYPDSLNKEMVDCLVRMAEGNQKESRFDIAEKYYAMACAYENENHHLYWALLQSKLKCKSNDELVTQPVSINKFVEYDNAISAAYDDPESLDLYIKTSEKQEEWIKNHLKEKKKKKSLIAFIASVAVLVGASLVFYFSYFKKYELRISDNLYNRYIKYSHSPGKRYALNTPITLTVSSHDGYDFDGWYIDGALVSTDDSYVLSIKNNIIVEPRFSGKTYTVTLDSNGGTYEGDGTYLVTYGEPFTFPTVKNAGTSDKVYTTTTFMGWKYNDVMVTDSMGYCLSWNIAGDVTITASVVSSDDGTIYFGSYPQTLVAATTQNGLNSISFDKSTWSDYGYYDGGAVSSYMFYKDVDTNGDGAYDYRGVYFTKYRPYYTLSSSSESNSYQDDNGYYTNKIYWFSYDPVKWDILKAENGKALIVTDLLIDSQQYCAYTTTSSFSHNGGTGYPNDYALSDIRKWLNDNFYDTVFSELEKTIILTTEVDNSVSSTGYSSNQYACQNTNDRMFLLSYKEASSLYSGNNARIAKLSDYAKCQGAYHNSSYDSGVWWLRSPYYYGSDNAWYVYYDGYLYNYNYVYLADGGVRAACWIIL